MISNSNSSPSSPFSLSEYLHVLIQARKLSPFDWEDSFTALYEYMRPRLPSITSVNLDYSPLLVSYEVSTLARYLAKQTGLPYHALVALLIEVAYGSKIETPKL